MYNVYGPGYYPCYIIVWLEISVCDGDMVDRFNGQLGRLWPLRRAEKTIGRPLLRKGRQIKIGNYKLEKSINMVKRVKLGVFGSFNSISGLYFGWLCSFMVQTNSLFVLCRLSSLLLKQFSIDYKACIAVLCNIKASHQLSQGIKTIIET